jgi:hypothetical protein
MLISVFIRIRKIYNRKAAAVAKWITEGCKPEKIVVGIAGKLVNGFRNLIKININYVYEKAYGRSFELENNIYSNSGAPTIG